MPDPRWLADAMLGRLARYLRFMGHDTRYIQGLSDPDILRLAREERRVLLTRDVALSGRSGTGFVLRSVELANQLREVRRAFPEFEYRVTFDRCTLCNGRLRAVPLSEVVSLQPTVPEGVRALGTDVYACIECGHPFWEGTHTKRVREYLEEVFSSG